jgi:hypothetical protein
VARSSVANTEAECNVDLPTLTLITGTGATLVVDLWALLRRRWTGAALPDYGLVGRWIAHMARGRFRHESIARSAAVRGERVLGWTAHYLIGIGFAALLLSMQPRPTLLGAGLFGIATVAAPFLLMQPGMGAGWAASRTPRPWAARAQSLVNHAVFGVGLYLAFAAGSLLRAT